jgi:hypothetical protein
MAAAAAVAECTKDPLKRDLRKSIQKVKFKVQSVSLN